MFLQLKAEVLGKQSVAVALNRHDLRPLHPQRLQYAGRCRILHQDPVSGVDIHPSQEVHRLLASCRQQHTVDRDMHSLLLQPFSGQPIPERSVPLRITVLQRLGILRDNRGRRLGQKRQREQLLRRQLFGQ
ncbi:hypothetical protein D3C71_1648290 [compost metagenome]